MLVKMTQKIKERGYSCIVDRVAHFHPVRGVDDFCRDEQQNQSGDTHSVLRDGAERMARLGPRLFRHSHRRDELQPSPDVVRKHHDEEECIVVFEFG